MASRRYIVFFDENSVALTADQISMFVKNNKYVDQWARPFPGMYMLKSDYQFGDVDASFTDIIGPAYFVICEIKNTANSSFNGLLPADVWDWFAIKPGGEAQIEKPD